MKPGVLESNGMILPSEVYKTATLLIEEYGELAPAGAFIKADQMSEQGNVQGRDIWMQIAKAAQELLSDERPIGAVLH